MFRWLRRLRESAEVARVLEAENDRLRDAIKVRDERHDRAIQLIRLLRDVNADLDAKLLEVTHGQG